MKCFCSETLTTCLDCSAKIKYQSLSPFNKLKIKTFYKALISGSYTKNALKQMQRFEDVYGDWTDYVVLAMHKK